MSTGTDTSPQQPGWNFCLPIEVRFRDVDMFGHVNNAAYLTYIESARVAYYAHLTGLKDPREFDMTVARAEVDFLKPAFYGQTLHVYTRAGRIGNKSWTLEHEMRDSRTGELVARGSTVVVHFEHAAQESKPLPPEIVELIERHEGRSLRGH
ncbi:MAG TPA: thioesterase family protein [Chloroflexia bacterium]|jgi:acyl-CoA thioester hydrolase